MNVALDISKITLPVALIAACAFVLIFKGVFEMIIMFFFGIIIIGVILTYEWESMKFQKYG